MILCSVCGKLVDEDDDYETCSQKCQDELERQQPYARHPPHSSPRQIEERPSTPGNLVASREDAA